MNVGVNFNMVTTTFDLPGYRITKNLGLVRGVTVRSRSILGQIGASLESLVGGNITLFEELCEKTRAEALELLMEHAAQLGANAILGVRYDACEILQGITEVLAYGTAVHVEPGS
ncbi:MAG TPA: YbjQ family protein [Candidatus Micrarchaeaceae archaeon]|nr:YbjQ family protein [Candidatus Micrarchaeaceae archaeon]